MKNINNTFFELLIKNNKEEIKKFIIENGKEGKRFCPISFTKGEENEQKESR